MFDLMSQTLVPNEPGKPGRVALTIHSDADELQQLRDTIDLALMGGPGVMTCKSASGVEIRIVIDRLGPTLPRN